jgi:hypothetical protein
MRPSSGPVWSSISSAGSARSQRKLHGEVGQDLVLKHLTGVVIKMAAMEGSLSKWTNFMKGLQYRCFVLDDNAGLLSYYTVSNCQ